ncbi:hypothetical protein F2P56_006019 [Juglans regia]|uniref:3,9-dihydroxypterocarpan 6A-monooxygenase-like n=2 Tax=Juglans regia TaxID=51240 RepID=A0A833XQE5_JUGRE|nr:3,9-dihydroxypterocarpan 6A-monooxygenase-like [Juglans regia]KAF5474086.1 hypothetical protein F2P56_006019 [Juglans regia]
MATAVDFTNYCYLFFFWIIATLVWSSFVRKFVYFRSNIRHPPSPPALPFIGHLYLLSSKLPKSFETLAKRYGPLMQIRIGDTNFLVASEASLAKEILKTHDVDFASKYQFGGGQNLIYKDLSFINCPYGTYWRFMKKLCVTKLFAGPQIDRFILIREQETLKLLKSLINRASNGEASDLSMELSTLTNNMICRMAMGKKWSENPNLPMEIKNLVRAIMGSGAKLGFIEVFGPLSRFDISGYGKKLRDALWAFDRVLEQIMKDYETMEMKDGTGEGKKDVMDILLETYRDPNAELKLTKEQIRFFFLELFLAGVDTTSAAVQWVMAELINHPEVFKKLRLEIESVVGSNRLVKESDIPNLPYLQAVIKETLRIHPPGALLRRQCNQDCKLGGYDVKQGTKILINAYTIMRDPKTWHEPDKFLPERFLMNSADTFELGNKGQDFNFLPFGGGRRACIGQPHASIVLHATIGSLIQCFDWKLQDAEKVDIKVVTGYAGAVAHSLMCYPIIHFNPFKG